MTHLPRLRATAYAPASVGNVAVGFDLLGFCFDVAGDEVTVERSERPGVMLSPGSESFAWLPTEPAKNTAGKGLLALIEDKKLRFGLNVTVKKGISLGSGMGGSAASAVASIVAASALLIEPLTQAEALSYALIGESAATGAYHPDNVAPCLLGGLALARVREGGSSARPQVDASSIPTPRGLWCALAKPRMALETKIARGALGDGVSLRDHVRQSGRMAEFLIGCFESKIELIARSLEDVLIEPQRAHLIAGFAEAKAAALAQGALGCSIAGAGPSVFAWCSGQESAHATAQALKEAFMKSGSACDAWSAPLPCSGARVIA